ncbi:VOC family protein [Nonomuraea sp. NPDC050394]|uniref:VOC family protein n=1 Tax=Nonomuraea sp. NPDC050394 TaxID=3364363 RepID=UPI00379F9F66
MTGPALRLVSCALTVHDVDEALGFYRDVLGFEAGEHVAFTAMRWVSVTPPSQPDLRIHLTAPGTDLMAMESPGCLIFVTDDCDATFEHIEAAGAEVMQEPINRPDGTRDCAFLDPTGNMLRFTEPATPCEAGHRPGHDAGSCRAASPCSHGAPGEGLRSSRASASPHQLSIRSGDQERSMRRVV